MRFWNQLSSRERLLVGSCVPVLALLIGYYYHWAPAMDNVSRLQIEVPQKTAELAWMEFELENAAAFLENTDGESIARPVLTVIESLAIGARVNETIQRVQPVGNDQVKLWFKSVTADRWFAFVEQLGGAGISVESATLTRASEGNIDVRVTFVR